jgi:hypothetical protein
MKYRLPSQRLNPRCRAGRLIAFHARRLALPIRDLRHAPPLDAIGVIHRCHRLEQALPLLVRDAFEHRSIGGNRFEQLNGLPQPVHQPSHLISVPRLHLQR